MARHNRGENKENTHGGTHSVRLSSFARSKNRSIFSLLSCILRVDIGCTFPRFRFSRFSSRSERTCVTGDTFSRDTIGNSNKVSSEPRGRANITARFPLRRVKGSLRAVRCSPERLPEDVKGLTRAPVAQHKIANVVPAPFAREGNPPIRSRRTRAGW